MRHCLREGCKRHRGRRQDQRVAEFPSFQAVALEQIPFPTWTMENRRVAVLMTMELRGCDRSRCPTLPVLTPTARGLVAVPGILAPVIGDRIMARDTRPHDFQNTASVCKRIAHRFHRRAEPQRTGSEPSTAFFPSFRFTRSANASAKNQRQDHNDSNLVQKMYLNIKNLADFLVFL